MKSGEKIRTQTQKIGQERGSVWACARAKEFSKLETQNTNHSCGKEQLYWILMIQESQNECQ